MPMTEAPDLTELTLDPPSAAGDHSGDPLLDEDYLILSTAHSAKGQEWESVFILNVSDGNFPSEFSTGKPEMIEEERRLLYVAMTRATDLLLLTHAERRGGYARKPSPLVSGLDLHEPPPVAVPAALRRHRPRARGPAGGGQHFRDTFEPTAARTRRRHQHAFGNQVHRWPF